MSEDFPTGSLPTIRLRPKASPNAIRHGFPWVYDNELVTDRRTRAIAPGSIVRLEDAERKPLGLAAYNGGSRIIARMLERDPEAVIGPDWLAARIARALALREALFDAPYYRLIHAEADGLPGVIVDRFGDTAVLQPNAAWAERLAKPLAEALCQVAGLHNVILNGQGRARALEGLDERLEPIAGTAPEAPLPVPMNGAVYMADLMGGQKTGLFFDQRPNHAFAARLAPGAEVLDVFSHVGGFSLAALAAGATSALAVDSSAPALALAEEGARQAGTAARFQTRRQDAFAAMEELAAEGRRFGLVACDPPAFAPNRKALDAGLRAYEKAARLAAGLVAPGGWLVLCSCSHAAGLEKFSQACTRGIGRVGRQAQLIRTGFAGPDHPQMPQLAESGYLKALFYRL